MRKISTFLIITGTVLLLSGCGSKMTLSEERLSGLAEKSVTDLQSGNFDAIYDNLSGKTRPYLPRKTIEEKWVSATEKIGKLVKNEDAKVIVEERYAAVSVVSEFEKNGVKTAISYNPKGEIIAFDVSLFPLETKPETTDVFEEKDLVLENGEYPLQARLTMPKNAKNPPIVVYIQDSGAWDLDETIGASANKPMKDIAHSLAEKGIASLRYDKRFFSYPEYAVKNAGALTIQDEVLDDVNKLLTLAGEQAVDKNRIYLLGHGMGGTLAPIVAENNTAVRGIISLASTPRRLEDIVSEQNMALTEANHNLPEKDRKQYIAQLKYQADEIKKVTDDTKPAYLLNMPTSYWNSLNKLDSGKAAEKLTIPMLFLQGSADFKNLSDKDFGEWKKRLAGNKNVDFKEYDGLNHMFTKTSGQKDITEYDGKASVEKQVADDIASWIGEN